MADAPLSSQELAQQLQQIIAQLHQLVLKLNREPISTFPSVTALQQLQASVLALDVSLNPASSLEMGDEALELAENLEKAYAEFDEFIEETAELPTEPSRVSSSPPEDTEIPLTVKDTQIPAKTAKETTVSPLPPIKTSEKSLLSQILTPIRRILPAGLHQKLSDGWLASVLGGIVAGVVMLTFLLISPNREEIAEVLPLPAPESESPTEIATPAELESPEPPQAILLEPPPEPEISPEQRLIQAVQADIADITRRYPEGLIDSIQADFPDNYLIVVLGDNWYQLRESRQDDIAKGIWQKAKNLDFQTLYLKDKDGSVVARSPVVGNQMIILRRTSVKS